MSSKVIAFLVVLVAPALATLYSFSPSTIGDLQALGFNGNTLNDGDIIELAAGAYDVPAYAPAASAGSIGLWLKGRGANGAKLTLRGAAGAGYPILQFGQGVTYGFLLYDLPGVQWTVQHVHFKGYNDGTTNSNNVHVCVFHKAYDTAMTDVIIEDCEMGMNSHDTESGSLTMEYCEISGCGNGIYSHQLYASSGQVDPTLVFTLRYSYMHDGKGGNGIKSRFPSNLIEYNWVDHSGSTIYRPLEMIGPDGATPSPGVFQSDVIGNVFIKNDTGTRYGLSRIGYDATGNSYGRYRFVGNTFFASSAQNLGFTAWGTVVSASFYDNIFYLPGSGAKVFDLASGQYTGPTPTLNASNNWIYTGSDVSIFTAQSVSFNTISGTNPGFNDLNQYDFRLTAASACAGAGLDPAPNPNLDNALVIDTSVTAEPVRGKIDSTTSNLRPNGVADIGAYSQIGATAPPTTATATASASVSTTAALTTNSVITTTAAAGGGAGAGAGTGAGGMTAMCAFVQPLALLLVAFAAMLLLLL